MNNSLLKVAKEDFATQRNNFLKALKWSPDGTCLLVASDDCYLRIYNAEQSFFDSTASSATETATTTTTTTTTHLEWKSALNCREGDNINDFDWFPNMNSQQPISCCFASTSRNHPIHLWDAYSGKVRASYNAYDHVDELEAAVSLAFTPDGQQLFAGYLNKFRVFDVASRHELYSTTTYHRKTIPFGVQGLVSCFAFDSTRTVAIGAYSGSIGVFDIASGEQQCLLTAAHGSGGITQLRLIQDGRYLISGARRNDDVVCRDTRTMAPLWRIRRRVPTNQRLQFDISSDNRYLITPSYDGSVIVYDIASNVVGVSNPGADASLPLASLASLGACATLDVFDECVNSVSIHPYVGASLLIAVGTGERRNESTIANELTNDSAATSTTNNTSSSNNISGSSNRKNLVPLESLSLFRMNNLLS